MRAAQGGSAGALWASGRVRTGKRLPTQKRRWEACQLCHSELALAFPRCRWAALSGREKLRLLGSLLAMGLR